MLDTFSDMAILIRGGNEMKSLKAANKYLATKLPGFELCKGNGYFYFWNDGKECPTNIDCVRIGDVTEDMIDGHIAMFEYKLALLKGEATI